ncbi:MAG: hypothetical protein ACRDSJ_08250 [Rubrobacteraceae bacterium]
MTTKQRSSLERMEGYSFPVLFSAGAQTRAEQVAARCERAHHYLKGVLEFDPALRLLALSPEDWEEHAAFPMYGMLHTDGSESLIVGEKPADFWQGVVRMLDDVLTPAQRAEAEAVYGVVDGRIDIAPFADLLVVHELGHLFHEQVPFRFPRLWLTELFANFCLHAYIIEREPDLLPMWLTLPKRMMSLPRDRVQHRSLDDFERLYVGVENYVWYQFGLVVAAKSIHDAAGVGALRRLHRAFTTHEGELTDPQLAALLEEQVHPAAAQAMRTWPK